MYVCTTEKKNEEKKQFDIIKAHPSYVGGNLDASQSSDNGMRGAGSE